MYFSVIFYETVCSFLGEIYKPYVFFCEFKRL